MKTLIPFYDIKKYPNEVLVVDAHHPQGFDLSHWRGATVPEGCQADTSTEIVLKAIEKKIPELDKDYITNNHYDIDGLLGVWSLFNPQLALKNKELITEIAQIADFREINFHYKEWKRALKIVCLLNEEEVRLFYPPFGAPEIAEKEMEACVPKYVYFLRAFTEMLQSGDQIKQTDEFLTIINQLEQKIRRETLSEIRLQVVEAETPLHYYSLYAGSNHADMVLSTYSSNRYELEYKYTTWVSTTRKHFPRLNLQLLCDRLNELETSGKMWKAEHFTDTAPILRLEGEKLSKKERYLSPSARPIYSSSIEPELFKKICISFFKEFYKDLTPGGTLDWKDVREINEKVIKEVLR